MFKKKENKKEIEYPKEWRGEALKAYLEDADRAIFLAQEQKLFLTRKYAETNDKRFLDMIGETNAFFMQKVEWKEFLEEEIKKLHG